jgi:probable F420-dependent oxidoreductase
MTATSTVQAARKRLGKIGVWVFGVTAPLDVLREQVIRIERLGYGSVWFGEGVGRNEIFAASAVLLGDTQRIVIGAGIANVHARHGFTTQAGGATLALAHPGRFVLGVGIGHPFQADRVGNRWQPLRHMRDHFDQMDAEQTANPPAVSFPRVTAALGPNMLELARERSDGVHPFLAPAEHTAFAREILGPDKLIVAHQTVLLETDPTLAREVGRNSFKQAIGTPVSPYHRNLRRFGFSHDELSTVEDRVVDAVLGWGDEAAVARRVNEQLDAGADHVLVSAPMAAPSIREAVDELERLAPALTGRPDNSL